VKAAHLLAGRRAERIAEGWLRQRGLRSLARNHRIPAGELDLVMRDYNSNNDRDCIVFVEVRYRRSRGYGGASASVSRAKQRRIAAAALDFLRRHRDYRDFAVRFDVVTLTGPLTAPVIDWYPRAFDADCLDHAP
jgi:putative endonuclease